MLHTTAVMKEISISKNTRANLLVLVSALLFGSYGLWQRELSVQFDAFNATWSRSIIIIVVLLWYTRRKKQLRAIEKADRRWMALSFGTGSLVLLFSFFGFEHLDIGPATLVFFTSYVLSQFVIGALLFSERLTGRNFISLGLGLVGLAFVGYTQSATVSILPVISLVASGICAAIEVGVTKKFSRNYSEACLLLVLYITTFVMSFALDIAFGGLHSLTLDAWSWVVQFIFASVAMGAFGSVVAGFKDVKASVGGLIGLSEVVFGVLFGLLFLGESLSLSVSVGMLLIIAASGLQITGEDRS